MNVFKKSEDKENNLLKNIGVYVFLNAMILLVLAFVIRIYYTDKYTVVVNEKYYNIILSDVETVEKDIRNIINSISLLKNSDFDSCMSYVSAMQPQAPQVAATINSFQNFMSSYDIVDSMLIVNRTLNTAITNDGMYDLQKYFDKNYSYGDYPYSYWRDYKSTLYHQCILSPTQVDSFGENKKIIPIVFSSIKDTVSSNLLVVNISIDKILEQHNIRKNLAPDSRFYIVSNFNDTIFHSESTPPPDRELVTFLTNTRGVNNGAYNEDNKYNDNLLIRYSSTSHILGYEYVILIPINELAEITNIKRTSNFMLTIIFLFIVGWFVMARKKIIKPVEEIEHNAMNYKQDAEAMRPVVCEKYVSDILNSPPAYVDGAVSEILAKSKITFKYDNFIAVIVRYIIDKQRMKTTAMVEKGNIIAELNIKIKLLLSKSYNVVNICGNDESLYVINVENADKKNEIVKIIDTAVKKYTDNEAIELVTGIGEVYRGHMGIKQSVESANYDLLQCITPEEVKKNTNTTGKSKYIYTKQNDDKLFNMLVAGYADEPMQLISEILKRNMNDGISENAQKELYRQIINTLIRVMDIKNIEYKSSKEQSSIDYIIEKLEMPNEEIYKYIIKSVNDISVKTKKYNTKLDFSKIIRYIDEHYAEDLYLDIIALHFGTSSKYLSRKLKEHLGMNFHKYLSQIRINHAKILLTSTNMSVEQVGQSVGYMSNTTFIRVFKSETGLSPSAYKKQPKP